MLEARAADLEVRRWELRLERSRITSPVDGVVVELLADGDVHALISKKVSAGDVLVWIRPESEE